ncbi:uncharacterized protein LOC128737875 [Sabethes cyaneus]|uniref:uncharacterized protein LOC128737875 n=1 Tax=Sabethes cyaneus TaxID=53552 RepID=UPI00237D7974|nr:uncharacterized protein LOC128737875 [Sabethes cyaneus]XP_053688715.1 uncharacterized protein LOC128737875 [Sabethes cyaneus]XP_053688791.1 uncharacterized protein LOC128737875 [Sabethes cyaneus]
MRRRKAEKTSQAASAITEDIPNTNNPICRFCLETSTLDMAIISSSPSTAGVPTTEEIWIMLGIKVDPHDDLPKQICVTCLTKVNYIKRIRKQFQQANDTLHQLHNPEPLHSNEENPENTDSETVEETKSLVEKCPSPQPSAVSYVQHYEPQEHCERGDELLTEDQITIVQEEEIRDEMITIIKMESDEDNVSGEAVDEASSIVDLLYTGRFVKNPTINTVPGSEGAVVPLGFSERASKSSESMGRPKKRRCYGRFRFEKPVE